MTDHLSSSEQQQQAQGSLTCLPVSASASFLLSPVFIDHSSHGAVTEQCRRELIDGGRGDE
ncbi:hypothetical protein JOB18_021578 [Solea senegalensis]|uniref:Uncharacterized protein n=1 Tax=Solea senegalensis TaxID=28829 RepID=A0AAV6S418_SOLSE|nr:hypothetical protein JOB18_021578 [Solea senegalensis]